MSGVVSKLLPRLLLQLTPTIWSDVPVRTKFVQILTHLHKRLASLTNVQVPIVDILELFTGQHRSSSLTHAPATSAGEVTSDDDDDDDDDEDEDETTGESKKDSAPPTPAVPSPNAIRSNFAQLFLELGFNRLSDSDQLDMLPSLVRGIPVVNTNQGSILLRLSVTALSKLAISTTVSIRRQQLSFLIDAPPAAQQSVIQFWQDVLLFRHPPTLPNTPVSPKNELLLNHVAYYKPTSEPIKILSIHRNDPTAMYVTIQMQGGREKQTPIDRISARFSPPGMSPAGILRVCGNAGNGTPRPPPSPSTLSEWKLSILKVLRTAEETLPKNLVLLPHLLIGTCDGNHEVREMATEYVKRVGTVGRKDLESPPIVQSLLSTFVGGRQQATPASWSLREKILEQLLHSTVVTTMAPWCVKLTFESLFGPGTTSKVQCVGCEFAKRFVESAAEPVLNPVKALMLQALSKMLRQSIASSYVFFIFLSFSISCWSLSFSLSLFLLPSCSTHISYSRVLLLVLLLLHIISTNSFPSLSLSLSLSLMQLPHQGCRPIDFDVQCWTRVTRW